MLFRNVTYCVGLTLLVGACTERSEPAPKAAPVAATSAAPVASPAAAAIAAVPVYLDSHGEEQDPCTLSEVRAVARAGARVPIHAGPGDGYAVVDSLTDGTRVIGCDQAKGWVGIVYPAKPSDDGPFAECEGTSSPVESRRPYRGACRSGWVRASAYGVLAG